VLPEQLIERAREAAAARGPEDREPAGAVAGSGDRRRRGRRGPRRGPDGE
jgi:hypothetical protein